MEIIKDLREEIDKIDREITSLLLERFTLVKKIGKIKRQNSLGILDSNREKEILNLLNSISEDKNKNEYLTQIYKTIMFESKKAQEMRF